MQDKETSRLSRLTAIVTLLQSKKLITAITIAEKFNISVRTVYSDISALEDAGIPILTEEGKDFRTFGLDRMQQMQITTAHFVPHKLTLPDYIEIERKNI